MTQPQQPITSSISKGINFHFQDGDNQIRAFASMFSGKEVIHFNGQEVNAKRSMRRRSLHTFTIDNIQYEIEFFTASILLGHINCTLIKNGTHVQTLKYQFSLTDYKNINGESKKKSLLHTIISFTISFAIGFFLAKYITRYLLGNL